MVGNGSVHFNQIKGGEGSTKPPHHAVITQKLYKAAQYYTAFQSPLYIIAIAKLKERTYRQPSLSII